MFRPFGLNVYSYERSYIIIAYGLIIFITVTFNDFIAYRFFPGIFNEQNWKVVTQLAWAIIQLFIIGITCFLYAVAIDAFPLSMFSFLKIELYVLLCSIMPIIVMVLLKQNYLLKQHLKEAVIFNKEIDEITQAQPEGTSTEKRISFTGENQNEKLELSGEDLYYISSQDNYFELVYREGSGISKKLLRGTLTRAEGFVATTPFIFRCHRAYIVNLKMVQSVEGNAQGYRLTLKDVQQVIPVSRAKGTQLHLALQALV